MNSEVASFHQYQPAQPTPDVIGLPAMRTLLQRARYLEKSPFLPHLPFLFWLMDTVRPRAFVQLGLEDGVPYFAACQAASRFPFASLCFGVAEEPCAIAEPLRRHGLEAYDDVARFLDRGLGEASHRLPDGSVDLMLLDLGLDENLLEGLLSDWLCKLSPRGVLLIHGGAARGAAEPVRRFLDRLSADHLAFTLDGGDGLAVVLHGPEPDERLVRLARPSVGDPLLAELRQVFGRLGALHEFEWVARAEARRAQAAQNRLEAIERSLAEASESRNEAERRLASLNAACEARTAEVAGLQARVLDGQGEAAARTAEVAELSSRLAREQQWQAEALARRDQALVSANQRIDAQAAEMDRLRAQLEVRSEELAQLTGLLERTRQELERTLRKQEALLGSTSWKLTAPIRGIARAMRPGR